MPFPLTTEVKPNGLVISVKTWQVRHSVIKDGDRAVVSPGIKSPLPTGSAGNDLAQAQSFLIARYCCSSGEINPSARK